LLPEQNKRKIEMISLSETPQDQMASNNNNNNNNNSKEMPTPKRLKPNIN
jgi:hypothetical protein